MSVNDPKPAENALPRELTRPVRVGNVQVGGGAPVSVQSMCTTKTDDPATTLAQIGRLADAGCEIVRVAIPSAAVLDGFGEICAASPLPVVADIHFDHRLAIEAARRGASALRVNPGNIGSWDKVDAVIDEAGAAGIPIRIGVNAGSLDRAIDAREDLTQPQKLVQSAVSFVRHFEERGFTDIVMSAKVHDVPATIQTNRELSRLLPHVPLHIGVTEAGTLTQGTVKNVAALSVLLSEGIGDTMRLSLTADPVEEVKVAWELLAALGMRRLHPELVSCPTCGRCQVDMIPIAEEVARRLQEVKAPISVAVMGCAVSESIRKVPEERMVDELFAEIESRFGEKGEA